MKSLFSSPGTDLCQITYIGVTLPTLNSDGTVSESPLRWLKLPQDLYIALSYDGLPPDYMLDKLINVHSGKNNHIRLARIVAVTISDFNHMRRQSAVPLKKEQAFWGARSQFVLPDRLLSEYVYDVLAFLYHDHSDTNRHDIYQDFVLWQRLMLQYGHKASLPLSTHAELRAKLFQQRIHRKTVQATSGYRSMRDSFR